MSDTNKLSFRLSPALQAALTARVRQHGGRVSDIIREALETYLGLRPTDRPTAQGQMSDIMSDIVSMVGTLVSDMADIHSRLERLEVREAQPSRVRQRPTEDQTERPTLRPTQGYDADAALARMRALKAQGLSLAQIATTLNDEGIPTRHGRPWHKGTVGYLLQPRSH